MFSGDDDDDAGEAREALRGFLAGFGVDSRQYDGLIERLIAETCLGPQHHGESPAACVLLEAEQQFERWLGMVIGAEFLAGRPALPIGRAAYLACGGPVRWTNLLLAPEPLPAPFVAAMRAAAPIPSPMPTPAAMRPQSLESWSIDDAAGLVRSVLETASIARPLITASIRLSKPLS